MHHLLDGVGGAIALQGDKRVSSYAAGKSAGGAAVALDPTAVGIRAGWALTEVLVAVTVAFPVVRAACRQWIADGLRQARRRPSTHGAPVRL